MLGMSLKLTEVEVNRHWSVLGNSQPTNITLSNATASVGALLGSLVGNIGVVDTPGNTHTITLPDNAGGLFRVVGNRLECATTLVAIGSPQVTIRATDQGGLSFDRAFTITIGL